MKNFQKKLLAICIATTACLSSALAQVPQMNPIQGPSAVCSQPAVAKTFTASASNSPTSYNWSVVGPSGVVIGSPSNAITSINFPFPYLNVTYTVYCSATNANGTSPTASFVVTVFETPTVTFSGATTICQGSATILSASPTILSASSTLSYQWTPSTGLSSTNTRTVSASPAATTNYTLLLTLGSCTNTAQVTVIVYQCVGLVDYFNESNPLVQVYPNPNNGCFILKTALTQKAHIINELGQTVRQFDLEPGSEIKVTGLKAGIYFVITPSAKHKIIVTD